MSNQKDSDSSTTPKGNSLFATPAERPEPEAKVPEDAKGQTSKNSQATKNDIHWLEGLSLVSNAVLALIGIGALYIYSGQLRVMQGQLDETVAERRPWMKIVDVQLDDSIPDAPLPAYVSLPPVKRIATLKLNFAIKNIGASVAQNINISGAMIFEQWNETVDIVSKEEQTPCEIWSKVNSGTLINGFSWNAVFPADEREQRIAVRNAGSR